MDSRLDLVEATASYLNTTFSTSVDSRFDYLEGTFSTSVDSRLDLVEATASYLNTTFSTSVDSRLDNLEAFSTSVQLDFVTQAELAAATGALEDSLDTKLNTSSFQAYTQSYSSSVASEFNVVNGKINGLIAFTGSYATTGSNTFIGNQTITGSLILSSSAAVELSVIGNSVFSGSFRGGTITLSVASQTASMDFSLGNFFSLTLPSASTTYLNPTNIQPGQTTQLLVRQGSVTGSLSYPTNLLFPTGSEYTASRIASAADIVSLVSFDTASLYAVSVKNLV